MIKMILKRLRAYYRKREWETSFIIRIVHFSVYMLSRTKSAIAMAGYTGKTKAVYFRKQGARIGENCDIAATSLGTEPYLVSIGNHVFISVGVTFHTHDGGVWIFRENNPGIRVYGTITIEDNCIIGRKVHLLPDIRIGKNSIVGAGSVVISDVPPNSIVMGVPARVIGSISKYEEKSLARWKEQKPPDLHIEEDCNWWDSKKNRQKLRRHLTNLFMNHKREEAGK